MNVSEYWLISAPGETTCQQTWDKLNQATSKQQLSSNWKFHIPDLKVGTLDQLVGLSDDLGKIDSYVEQIAWKLSQYMGEVMEQDKEKWEKNLKANETDLASYLTKFQWDLAKYPIKQSLQSLTDIIVKQIGQIEADLKVRAQAYNALKSNLQSKQKKTTGSLLTRNLGSLVKKEHFVLDSEYLITLLVVVPLHSMSNWTSLYEKLTEMIVPKSSQLITQDNEHALMTVTLFQTVVDEFKFKARENRFIVRDFVYNAEELEAGESEITKLNVDIHKQYGFIVRWLKVNFSEAFMAMTHVKALRVFVESVLRYGLPVNFQSMILLPQKKTHKKLRDTLNNLYSHLDSSGSFGASGKDIDIPTGLGGFSNEYYPYVFYKINIDMIGQSGMV